VKKIIVSILFLTALFAQEHYSNALRDEESPYLQQHAHNPINWYPWGKEALEKAKKENKHIFLSIGYSTCHWCYVMERESFTDVEVAKLLNDDFISIKIDKEEYPQIDKKYQKRYLSVHGKRGGWPLSVFLTSKQEVLHLGTYIPKAYAYEKKGLMHLLPSLVSLDKDALDSLIQKNEQKNETQTFTQPLKNSVVLDYMKKTKQEYDARNGGFDTRPKFPEASKLSLLLDIYKLNGDKHAFTMAEHTLRKMAQAGIYDQIGGGFFRYTVDESWQNPHFEKMLYTNAELLTVYVKVFELTKDSFYKKIVDETIAQIEQNYMQKNEQGKGFYLSASDADSDGEEGGYFIYEYTEIKEDLKKKGWAPQEIEDTLEYLGIEEEGNVDGDLSLAHITSEKIPKRAGELKEHLKSVSDARTFPFVDKKINTAWASMMITALYHAARIDKKYLVLAERRLHALLGLMRQKNVLYHQTLFGSKPKQEALLEDYAFLIRALHEAYIRTYNPTYLSLSIILSEEALEKFYKNKRWYLSNDLVEVVADFDDRHYTSPLSQMLDNLLSLSSLTDELKYQELVQESMINMGAVLKTDPTAASKLVHTYLRLERGDVIIHAKKEKLLLAQQALDKIRYPFTLSKTQESDEYLACKSTMCFANDTNITKLITKINKVVK